MVYFEEEEEEVKPKKRKRIPAWLAEELAGGEKSSFGVDWIEDLKQKQVWSWDYIDMTRLAEWVLQNTSASDRIVEGLLRRFEETELGNKQGARERKRIINDLIGYYDFEKGMRNKSFSLDQKDRF